ncbi:MAG: glycine cleavage system protein GcvH [Candidatus Handelsmanbacteria bacterium]|nr:glycine cleavage system protein GcvH [Candidatus Handelsmanbacteria bacterium]
MADGSEIPEELKYSEDHEWLAFEGKTGTVGITDYAQSQLGDIVFVELPEVGQQLERGQVFGTIEAVKTVAEVYAPVSGEVVEVNAAVQEGAEVINAEPYGAGWLIKIRLADPKELSPLLSAGDYAALIADL